MFRMGHTVIHQRPEGLVKAGFPELAVGIVTGVTEDGRVSMTLFQSGRMPEDVADVDPATLRFPEAPGG